MGVPFNFLHFIFILDKVIDTLSFQSLTTLPNHVTLYYSATYHIVTISILYIYFPCKYHYLDKNKTLTHKHISK
jgi:hypothetical protein